jgi:organic hydroperoxide reductase OsmC/OhrA
MADIFISHLEWAGAAKGATRDPATFSRDLNVSVEAITLPMSSAPSYRGDPSRANPEQLFVAALSACQALTYLVLAAKNQITVVGYTDDAEGRLELVNGKVRMSRVTLRPHITLDVGANETRARELVDKAHRNCFIANSVSATVEIAPTFAFAEALVGTK